MAFPQYAAGIVCCYCPLFFSPWSDTQCSLNDWYCYSLRVAHFSLINKWILVPVHITKEKCEIATITAHFGFVFEENLDKKFTWLSRPSLPQKVVFSNCFPSNLNRKAGVSKFLPFEKRFRKASFFDELVLWVLFSYKPLPGVYMFPWSINLFWFYPLFPINKTTCSPKCFKLVLPWSPHLFYFTFLKSLSNRFLLLLGQIRSCCTSLAAVSVISTVSAASAIVTTSLVC